jgi:hypothetical protein
MTPSLQRVPDPGHNPTAGPAEAAELAATLTDLAERYLAVTRTPDSLEALWRAYHDQQRALLELAVLFDHLAGRVATLERQQQRLRGAS